MDHLQAVNTMACERYLLDEMTEAERNSFEDHYFSCLDCADDVRVAGLMRDGVRAGLVEGRPAVLPFGRRGPGRVGSWRSSVVLPWAAAATLALVLGYQSLATRFTGSSWPGLGPAEPLRTGPIALDPVTLRPATRGPQPTVPIGQGGAITLAVDLGDARFESSIRYQLKRTEGTVVASGELTAPQPGMPLLLLIPPRMLRSSEHYVLSLLDPRNSALTSEDYRFTVGAP
jgi:hypothetical protein